MKNKTNIYCGSARGAEILAQYLELQGYSYGYPSSGKCQRRSANNMPFITVHEDLMLYSGSKGAAVDVFWKKLTDKDLNEMLDAIKESALDDSDIGIYNKFYTMFGKAGMDKVLDGFGTRYKHFGEVNGRRREIVVKRMKQALATQKAPSNHSMAMSRDGERLERVWIAATGREIPLSEMKDDHLHNTILLIDRRMAEGEWVIGGNEDLAELLAEMDQERQRRKMPLPLIPIISLPYRKRRMNND